MVQQATVFIEPVYDWPSLSQYAVTFTLSEILSTMCIIPGVGVGWDGRYGISEILVLDVGNNFLISYFFLISEINFNTKILFFLLELDFWI